MAAPKQDMGTGSVKKLMAKMAVPALVGQVVNLLYNIVSTESTSVIFPKSAEPRSPVWVCSLPF